MITDYDQLFIVANLNKTTKMLTFLCFQRCIKWYHKCIKCFNNLHLMKHKTV